MNSRIFTTDISPDPEHLDSTSSVIGVFSPAGEIWPSRGFVAWIYLESRFVVDLLFHEALPKEKDISRPGPWNYDNGFRGEGNVGEDEEVFEDYIFHGGDVGIVAGTIGATDCGNWGCFGTECVNFELYMR